MSRSTGAAVAKGEEPSFNTIASYIPQTICSGEINVAAINGHIYYTICKL